MSLILDALKKSEEERRRGQPPSLHSPLYPPRRAPRRVPVWAASAGAVVLCAGLAGAWWVQDRVGTGAAPSALAESGPDARDTAGGAIAVSAEEPALAREADAVVAAARPASFPTLPERFATMPGPAERESLPVSPQQGEAALGGVDALASAEHVSGGGAGVPDRSLSFTPTVVVMAPAQGGQEPGEPASTPAGSDAVPAQPAAVAAAPVAAVAAQPVAGPAAIDPAVTHAADVAAAPAAVADSAGSKLPALHELAYATRRELPKLDLSMHVWSELAEERFVVLNGKRYTLATPILGPELKMIDIIADGVVLEYRGQRFLLPRQAF
jgi:general secretion pathway protein B